MRYISTRGADDGFTSEKAIIQGIASDGGLLVPESIPVISPERLKEMACMSYQDIALEILSSLLDDYSYDELRDYIDQAYSEEKFGLEPAPLVQLNKYNEREYLLELWHGPTSAFKDIALQLLPYLMSASLRKTGEKDTVCILTATSGDTGKAALEGFKDVEGTRVIVFYPAKGVSDIQRLQMVTQEGSNLSVVAVDGCFDDTQTGVKTIFSDDGFAKKLHDNNLRLSSANSINWGRIAPQIVYYFSAYTSLVAREKIESGEKINIVVPTGNFGNILSAWYAMKMGLPVNKLICTSNRNKVLSDFLRNGTYDRRREFYKTITPSMDILISSNLERLLFELTDHDHAKVARWMEELKTAGNYTVDSTTLKKLQEVFVGGFADEMGTIKTIRDIYDRCDNCIDPHTAVGFNVYERYYARSGDTSKTLFISTASPFKFPSAVCDAIFGNGYSKGRSEEVLLRELSKETGVDIPAGLIELNKKLVLHNISIPKNKMEETVQKILLNET